MAMIELGSCLIEVGITYCGIYKIGEFLMVLEKVTSLFFPMV